MKKIVAALPVFILLTTCVIAQNTVTRSSITFKTRNLGIGVDGSIGGLQAAIHFDPNNLAGSSIEASVDVNTLSTDNSLRDDHLKSDEFFDVTHYPKISLKSTSIKYKSGSRYVGEFNLTIKNKTKTVEIPFTVTPNGDTNEYNGTFKINRLDFGIGGSSLTLSDQVSIVIVAVIKK